MKKQGFDIMKYIPIAVMAVSLVSGYTLLGSRVSGAEEKIKDLKDTQATISKDTGDIKVSEAMLQSKVDSSYELLKDLKESLKEINKHG